MLLFRAVTWMLDEEQVLRGSEGRRKYLYAWKWLLEIKRHMAMVSMNLNDLHSTLLEISFPFHLHGETLAVMDTFRNV